MKPRHIQYESFKMKAQQFYEFDVGPIPNISYEVLSNRGRDRPVRFGDWRLGTFNNVGSSIRVFKMQKVTGGTSTFQVCETYPVG